MNKDTVKKTRHAAALQRDHSSSMIQQSASPAKDRKTLRPKREVSPEQKTRGKRTRVSEMAEPSNSSEDGRVRAVKRKVIEDREDPSKKLTKKRRGSVERRSNPVEGCSTTVGDVTNRGGKRKVAEDGEGPRQKKKRTQEPKETKKASVEARQAQFHTKYKEQNQLGEGGCGSVFAGYRTSDNLPVAIKHIPRDKVFCRQVDQNGRQLSVEVAVMQKLTAGTTGSVGASAPVSLLDWYDLGQELILVMERPVPSEDLLKYTEFNGGTLQEEEAKTILKQLVDAAKELQDQGIFHRDIKVENILIEIGSNSPRVRLIDFGLSCFAKKGSFFRTFYGTSAHIPPEWYSRCTYKAGPTTVWQLGVVLFEILHNKAPFETNKFLGNKLKINRKLSKDCQDFLRMCLTKVPEQRPTLEELQRHPWLR
ncbi:serine/threonine-protein kinase pim-1 [Lates calcarifer]|uniref:non-specific serine/threonine protein kinase n=1 Tax=Lates calcarifer TaxID=8187 RepID=A0A4W6DSX7_LATCA|nr:serine/threonine-protein kinase pim-1 [Lates calcarifer]